MWTRQLFCLVNVGGVNKPLVTSQILPLWSKHLLFITKHPLACTVTGLGILRKVKRIFASMTQKWLAKISLKAVRWVMLITARDHKQCSHWPGKSGNFVVGQGNWCVSSWVGRVAWLLYWKMEKTNNKDTNTPVVQTGVYPHMPITITTVVKDTFGRVFSNTRYKILCMCSCRIVYDSSRHRLRHRPLPQNTE